MLLVDHLKSISRAQTAQQMLPLLLLLLVESFRRRENVEWQTQTTERYRIDMHTLQMLKQFRSVVGLYLPRQLMTLDTRCRSWIANELLNKQSAARLRLTSHLKKRLLAYRNQWSRSGTFIQLYSDEAQLALKLPQLISPTWRYQLVEIGLNRYGNVCKMGLLLPLDQFLAQAGNRKLFLLVGCDGGLKSLYTVQGEKHRARYRVKDTNIAPLHFGDLVARSV